MLLHITTCITNLGCAYLTDLPSGGTWLGHTYRARIIYMHSQTAGRSAMAAGLDPIATVGAISLPLHWEGLGSVGPRMGTVAQLQVQLECQRTARGAPLTDTAVAVALRGIAASRGIHNSAPCAQPTTTRTSSRTHVPRDMYGDWYLPAAKKAKALQGQTPDSVDLCAADVVLDAICERNKDLSQHAAALCCDIRQHIAKGAGGLAPGMACPTRLYTVHKICGIKQPHFQAMFMRTARHDKQQIVTSKLLSRDVVTGFDDKGDTMTRVDRTQTLVHYNSLRDWVHTFGLAQTMRRNPYDPGLDHFICPVAEVTTTFLPGGREYDILVHAGFGPLAVDRQAQNTLQSAAAAEVTANLRVITVLVLDTQAAPPGIACDTICYVLRIGSGADTGMEQERNSLVQLWPGFCCLGEAGWLPKRALALTIGAYAKMKRLVRAECGTEMMSDGSLRYRVLTRVRQSGVVSTFLP